MFPSFSENQFHRVSLSFCFSLLSLRINFNVHFCPSFPILSLIFSLNILSHISHSSLSTKAYCFLGLPFSSRKISLFSDLYPSFLLSFYSVFCEGISLPLSHSFNYWAPPPPPFHSLIFSLSLSLLPPPPLSTSMCQPTHRSINLSIPGYHSPSNLVNTDGLRPGRLIATHLLRPEIEEGQRPKLTHIRRSSGLTPRQVTPLCDESKLKVAPLCAFLKLDWTRNKTGSVWNGHFLRCLDFELRIMFCLNTRPVPLQRIFLVCLLYPPSCSRTCVGILWGVTNGFSYVSTQSNNYLFNLSPSLFLYLSINLSITRSRSQVE